MILGQLAGGAVHRQETPLNAYNFGGIWLFQHAKTSVKKLVDHNIGRMILF